MSNEIKNEALRLYDLGFTPIWLHPKSKRPIAMKWATTPRESREELTMGYVDGLNVGVRLGRVSKIADKGYLAVIDVDVKSTDPRHKDEAYEAAAEIMGFITCPTVESGRGNGSRHYYFLTHEPFKTFNHAVSKEKVKVFMPSKQPSKHELKTLTKEEIEGGLRYSVAWEVSLYSDGRQVVLPPSIHPDSGKPYMWSVPVVGAQSLPVLEIKAPTYVEAKKGLGAIITGEQKEYGECLLEGFEVEEVELSWLNISEAMKRAIIDGDGVNDRSAYLVPASIALLSAGCTRNEVLTVLTDPETHLGACAYEHAKTKSRDKAAYWLWKYTVQSVMMSRDAVTVFKGAPPIGESVKELTSKDEIEAQFAENKDDPEARGYRFKGKRGGLVADHCSLLKRFESEFIYKAVIEMKTVFIFNGTHFVESTPMELRAYAERHFNPRPEEKERVEFQYKVLANNQIRRNFFFDSIDGKINFKNGVLDLADEVNSLPELLAHSPDYGFRGVLPYDYDADAKCPTFKKWINEVMMGDQDLVAILQEFMGYVVRGGEYKYHKALWLGGVGRNGKSTFVDLLKALVGAENYSVIGMKTLLTDKFASSGLDGKIANFSEETSPKEFLDSSAFKNLTGDGESWAQKKFGDAYTSRNRAKIIMTYNDPPDLHDLSTGMLSRPIIIPFRRVFKEEEQDRGIKKKLFKELSGIFNFALEGWKRLEAQEGFTRSARSEAALTKVKDESCNVFQWIENHVVFLQDFNPNAHNPEMDYQAAFLYSAYKKSERYAYKFSEFGRRLNRHPKMKERWVSRRDAKFYRGLRVRG